MKNKLLYLMLLVALVPFMSSCDEDTKGVTFTTYYAAIELLGDNPLVLNAGDTYVEAGCTADLEGEDVTDQVMIDNSGVDTSTWGIYSVSYLTYNVDGFSSSVTRTVYVVNGDNIDNLYMGEVEADNGYHYYDSPIYITDNGDGTYEVDDILGGYYFNGYYAGYEPDYDFHAEANIAIDDDGNVTQVGDVGSWFYQKYSTQLTEGTIDFDTRTFYLTVVFNGVTMDITLRPITK